MRIWPTEVIISPFHFADMERQGVSLKRKHESTEFDLARCVICQEVTDTNPTGTDVGRRKVVEAAAIRQDPVYEGLQTVDQSSLFTTVQINATNNTLSRKPLIKSNQTLPDKLSVACLMNQT